MGASVHAPWHSTVSIVEAPVRGVLADARAGARAGTLDDLRRAAQVAGDVVADAHDVLADRPQVEHRVEGCDTVDLDRLDAEAAREVFHDLRRDPAAELFLAAVEGRDQRGAPVADSGWRARRTRAGGHRAVPSAIDLPHDEIEAADDRDEVGQQAALSEERDGLHVHQARRAHVAAQRAYSSRRTRRRSRARPCSTRPRGTPALRAAPCRSPP